MGLPINAAGQTPEVTVREAQRMLVAAPGGAPETGGAPDTGAAVLVDVREQWEYAEGHVAGAVLIPLSEFTARFQEVPRDREALIICHSGYRSMQATIFLRRQGYSQVANVMGGMEEWEAAGLPIEREAR